MVNMHVYYAGEPSRSGRSGSPIRCNQVGCLYASARLTPAVAATCLLYTDQIDQRGHADMSDALVHNAIVLMDLELG